MGTMRVSLEGNGLRVDLYKDLTCQASSYGHPGVSDLYFHGAFEGGGIDHPDLGAGCESHVHKPLTGPLPASSERDLGLLHGSQTGELGHHPWIVLLFVGGFIAVFASRCLERAWGNWLPIVGACLGCIETAAQGVRDSVRQRVLESAGFFVDSFRLRVKNIVKEPLQKPVLADRLLSESCSLSG